MAEAAAATMQNTMPNGAGRRSPPGPAAGAAPLLVPAEEYMLLCHARDTGAELGVLVLGDGDPEGEELVIVALARGAYEAWTIVATGVIPAELNVARRDPARLIAIAVPPDDLPAPEELVAVEVRVTSYHPAIADAEAVVRGWYLRTPDLDLRSC